MSKPMYPEGLSVDQQRQLDEYAKLLYDVNKQFNLISRGDMEHVKAHHILHCLALAEKSVSRETSIVDWGSGGGLPAIPLAIVWPDVEILAVDSNAKKTRSIELFCRRLGIPNCKAWHGRAEEATGSFQYSVSRATAPLVDLWSWHQQVYSPKESGQEISPNHWREGLICLKGGDLKSEVKELQATFPGLSVDIQPLQSLKQDPFFNAKYSVEVFVQ